MQNGSSEKGWREREREREEKQKRKEKCQAKTTPEKEKAWKSKQNSFRGGRGRTASVLAAIEGWTCLRREKGNIKGRKPWKEERKNSHPPPPTNKAFSAGKQYDLSVSISLYTSMFLAVRELVTSESFLLFLFFFFSLFFKMRAAPNCWGGLGDLGRKESTDGNLWVEEMLTRLNLNIWLILNHIHIHRDTRGEEEEEEDRWVAAAG